MAASLSRVAKVEPDVVEPNPDDLQILLLEDSASDALLLADELKEVFGDRLHLMQVTSLSDALLWLRERHFDIVLTDLNLPDSNGIETFRWLHNAAPDLPIVVLTSDQNSQLVTELFRLGAQDCLIKGEYVGCMLMRAIHSAVQRQRTTADLDARLRDVRLSEQRIRQIVEASMSAFLVVDTHDIIQYANPAAGRMLRLDDRALVGRPFKLPVDNEAQTEIEIYCHDGSRGTAELQIVAALWDGKQARLVSLHDITARKMAEDELQATNVRLRAALEGAGGIGTWNFHIPTQSVSWDKAVAKWLGNWRTTYLGAKTRTILARIYHDDREYVKNAFQTAIDSAGDIDIEFRMQFIDGEIRWLAAKGHADSKLVGKPKHITGACMDVTARKTAEMTQMRTQKLEALGTLAAGIAHDFNNILGAINGNAKLALESAANDVARERLENISLAGTRAAELVRQILTFSRAGEPTHDPIELAPILEETRRLLRSTIPPQINVRVLAETKVATVAADPTQIHQIVVNLMTNAWHAIGSNQAGTIDVKLENVDVRDASVEPSIELKIGNYVRLTVSDNGRGMDRATLERIFDPFFTTKAVGQGTGLGLSVVHGIVRSCGGAVAVTSSVGVGSSFKLYFPAVYSNVVDILKLKPKAIPRGNGERILYVDDDDMLAGLGEEVLQNLGYVVDSYCDPVVAVDNFRAQPDAFDIVVTDLSMPNMSGLEMGKKLLAIRPNIPIVVTTGYLKAEDQAAAQELGIREIVLKPQNVGTLGFVLNRILRKD